MDNHSGLDTHLSADSDLRNNAARRRRVGGVVPLVCAISILSGCSVLLDAPSQDGVQIVKSVGRTVAANESAATIPSSAVLDLTRVRKFGQNGAANGSRGREGTRKIDLTSSDAVRDLQERPLKTVAEKKLVLAIGYFNNEKVDQARKVIDLALIADLRQAADRAVAYMYLGFIYCFDFDKNVCALQFRRMYAEEPGYLVTGEAPGYSKWFPVLQEVTAQYLHDTQPEVSVGNGSVAPVTLIPSALLVSKTPDGSSQLLLNLRPGGAIAFDGQSVGDSPPVRLIKVPPGLHLFVLSSGQSPLFAVDVDVGVGEQIEIRRGVQ